jgi:hypothetical protein
MIAYTRHGTNKLSGEKCQKQDVILESIFRVSGHSMFLHI